MTNIFIGLINNNQRQIYRTAMGGCLNIRVHDSMQKEVQRRTLSLKSAVITENFMKPFRDTLLPIILKRLNKTHFQLKLLYRGSTSAFLAKKFHRATHGIPNTIVVVKSQSGMVFGGFTPCKWEDQVMYQYVSDPEKHSFLFRLTSEKFSENEEHQEKDSLQFSIPFNKSYVNIKNQHKVEIFDLLDDEHAILNNQEDGPVFGGGRDLNIADHCDKNQNWANIGKSYECQYVFGSDKANSLLAGNTRFKVEEYEVWGIEFEDVSLENTLENQQ